MGIFRFGSFLRSFKADREAALVFLNKKWSKNAQNLPVGKYLKRTGLKAVIFMWEYCQMRPQNETESANQCMILYCVIFRLCRDDVDGWSVGSFFLQRTTYWKSSRGLLAFWYVPSSFPLNVRACVVS